MKNRDSHLQREDTIVMTTVVAIIIALFATGFFISWNFLEKLLSDEQFKMCEKIAQDVYSQKGNVIVEVPKDYVVNTSTTIITVALRSPLCRGKILARLENGKLVTERYYETARAIFNSCGIGLIFIITVAVVFIVILKIGSGK